MALPNRMSLRPCVLWLTLNLALIIQCLSWNNIFISFNFTYPLRCLRIPQVEYHWIIQCQCRRTPFCTFQIVNVSIVSKVKCFWCQVTTPPCIFEPTWTSDSWKSLLESRWYSLWRRHSQLSDVRAGCVKIIFFLQFHYQNPASLCT
jgi:hypothetical protein